MLDTTAMPPSPLISKRRLRARRAGWLWLALTSVLIAAVAVGQYMTDNLQNLANNHVALAPVYATKGPIIGVLFYVHIIFAGVALILGPLHFVKWIRARHLRVHRFISCSYIVSVLIASPMALVMSTLNSIGISGFFGFASLALLWGFTTVKAYSSIREGDVAAYQAWMIRSFALTYGAVMLRLWFPLLIAAQLIFARGLPDIPVILANAYAPTPYLCWIPNIVLAEILIARRGLPALRMTRHPEPPVSHPLK
jgi:hypothetical protein